MSKKPPKPVAPVKKSLSRGRGIRDPLTTFHIFTEGKITEPEYIKSFYTGKCEKKKVILAPINKAAGVPMTLVEACVKKKEELRRAAKRDSFEGNFVLWAVFDIDIHPYVDEAIALATANGIRCIVSNPCVEVWGLMHKSLYEKPSTRHQAQAELAKVLPDYHHDDNPIFPWSTCQDLVESALTNATNSLGRREKEGQSFPKGNPSTNFHILLEELKGDKEE